jgi:methylenetetrahydrofolate reductase (NADPH)
MSSESLEGRLRAGRFAVTGEVVPPLSPDPQALLDRTRPLAGLSDAVNITDGASARTHLDALTAAGILVRAGIEPILQLTCRDRNRIALQSLLLGAGAQGVRNILVLAGDDPSAGDQPDAKAVYELDSKRLLATARLMRDQGVLPNGREIHGKSDFFLGCADLPTDPAPAWVPDDLLRKLDAGAQFVQTQFCMDAAIARRYIERLGRHGITERAFILIGLGPLASVRSALWIRTHLFGSIIPDRVIERLEHATDAQLEGRRICLELMHEMQRIPGIAGVHLMAPLNEAALPAVIGEFRATQPEAAYARPGCQSSPAGNAPTPDSESS